ncbi:hypothetical protein F2Q69_00037777 [Brassica cretica]|uniref:Uncharacterized protein n=1 Tax=Brassica cretica TaxID=69181 RepID=A0A8S9SLP4_BRACR|nr:hypothetical protein F2Q69_00037777 [Brassica cretica]
MAATKMFILFCRFLSHDSHIPLIYRFFRSRFGYAGFSDLEDFWARRLPDDFQEVFQTTSRKSSRLLLGSLLTESYPMSPFHNRSERLGFNQKVLIFHLNMFYRSGFDIHVF